MNALLAGRQRDAMQLVLQARAAGWGVEAVYLHIFEPTQHEVGRLWELNAASVADEHYCTAATQLIMAQFWPEIMATPRVGRTAVCAAVPGDRHELGLRMAGDFFEMAGWDVHFLGSDLPAEDTVDAVMRRKPDVLALSASMAQHTRPATRLVEMVRLNVRPTPRILIGGAPFDADPSLRQRLAVDAYAPSGPEGVALAEQLVAP